MIKELMLGILTMTVTGSVFAADSYIVKEGDSLSKIAATQIMNRQDYVDCLQAVNHISNINRISVGEKLILPSIQACKKLLAPMAYQLCSGNLANQTCQKFQNKDQCMVHLKQCQKAKGQVKPWLCGSCHPIKSVPESKQALPPAYLSVKGFKACLSEKSMGSWNAYCMPEIKPNLCDEDAWIKLSQMNIKTCD
ncbi:LysM peptidoglycan-binding domain-containing protein [Thiotrichales bacterium 19S3-7]|nr:LysM peptidoglycan-binding domain-containing protein [Thiotrichales bacterium 19S3-7]MCF6801683.1 LysM peptidoglycan-binding domain-containing protein [Thiotrichales bacterium 19S3-11]